MNKEKIIVPLANPKTNGEMERELDTEEDFEKQLAKTPFIAFLDILGFSELVRNNDHETLVDLYKKLVVFPVAFYEKFHKREQKQLEEELREKFNPTGLRLVNISDSIIIWTNDCKEISLVQLLFAVNLLMSFSMTNGVPLRGTVRMGNFEVLEQNGSLSIVGRALVEAYEMEKQQQWSGCIVDKGIFNYLKSFQKVVMQRNGPLNVERLSNLIIEYDVPLKENKVVKSYVINWANDLKLRDEEIRQSFSKFNKREKEAEKITPLIEEKIENTILFFNYVQSLE